MQYPIKKPEIVEKALELAGELGFAIRPDGNPLADSPSNASCCIDAVGSLLQTLCASLQDGAKVGEIGTGAGVGTAWLGSGLTPRSTLTSVEIDPRLHTAVAELFAAHQSVTLLNGDWRDAFTSHAPFDLLFAGREIGVSFFKRLFGCIAGVGGLLGIGGTGFGRVLGFLHGRRCRGVNLGCLLG